MSHEPSPAPGSKTPFWPCLCGGQYRLGFSLEGRPVCVHTAPTCSRYDAIDTDADATRFSEENRRGLS